MARFPQTRELFEGRYRVLEQIGSGGFARVYRAVQEDLGREVALKLLAPVDRQDGDALYPPQLVERFNQEARLVSQLRDPHTITMYDYGRTESGLLYMVFEYVNGLSIKQLVDLAGALEPERVMTILRQALLSLQEAHMHGVLHRDIKPSNIMTFEHVGRKDQVKVLDFGIAKVIKVQEPSAQDLTADGALIGTPRYMSPEQIRGDELGPRSDIYSLGLVAYEMLVGERAIDSASSVTIIGKQLDPAPFYVPEDIHIPYGVRHIANRMLAKDLDARYTDAAEVLADIDRWDELEDDTISQRDPTLVEALRNREDPSTSSAEDSPSAEPTSSGEWLAPEVRKALVPLIGIAAVFSATIGIVLWGGDEPQTHAVAPPSATASQITPADENPVPEMMKVVTVPSGLKVDVNGRTMGESPVSVPNSEVNFPALVAARLDSTTVRKIELDGPRPNVTLDFSEVVERRARVEGPAPRPVTAENAAAEAPSDPTKRPSETTAKPDSDGEKAVEPAPADRPRPKPERRPKPQRRPKTERQPAEADESGVRVDEESEEEFDTPWIPMDQYE